MVSRNPHSVTGDYVFNAIGGFAARGIAGACQDSACASLVNLVDRCGGAIGC